MAILMTWKAIEFFKVSNTRFCIEEDDPVKIQKKERKRIQEETSQESLEHAREDLE